MAIIAKEMLNSQETLKSHHVAWQLQLWEMLVFNAYLQNITFVRQVKFMSSNFYVVMPRHLEIGVCLWLTIIDNTWASLTEDLHSGQNHKGSTTQLGS